MDVDLRSDTLTKPTAGMMEAMMHAKVGDDVFGEDPTVKKLENRLASYFGMEAGLFCPSGTMTNQIAIRLHTQPQDEVICDRLSHIYNYEGGGIAYNSLASVRLINGDRGRITAEDIIANINPDDIHYPVSRLVGLENTVNKGGGSIYPLTQIEQIAEVCKNHNLKLHLDGARLFNALEVTKDNPVTYGKLFDTISICLSKGLGAPVGSVLIGTQNNIKRAKRIRKVLGGSMRQAGFIAAAGLYAFEYQRDRITEDHQRARILAEALTESKLVEEILPVETNIVIFKLAGEIAAENYLKTLAEKGIKALPFGPKHIRMVTHLDFHDDHLEYTAEKIKKISGENLLLNKLI